MLLETIDKTINELTPTNVAVQVAQALQKELLDTRTKATLAVLDRRKMVKAKLAKVVPDVKTYDETGKEISVSYSKKVIDEKNLLTGQLAKIEEAIKEAFEANKWEKLLAEAAKDKNASSNSTTAEPTA